MNKSDLISQIAGDADSWSKREVEGAVNTIFGSLTDALVRGDRIEIRGLGSFRVKERQCRQGRNPKTGETVAIPAHQVPCFVAGKHLKHAVSSL
mgnify:CR=1 FL=1